MEINVVCENSISDNFIFDDRTIELFSKKMLCFLIENNKVLDFTNNYNYNFDVNICDNNFIHEINKTYRNIDKPTDVITFALYFDSDEKFIMDNTINLGQILISADKVISQSQENKVSLEFEFLNLLAHGILHLLGFDHQSDELLNEMLALQGQMIEDIHNVKI